MTLLMLFPFPEVLFLPIPGRCPTHMSSALLVFSDSLIPGQFNRFVCLLMKYIRVIGKLRHCRIWIRFLYLYFQIDNEHIEGSDKSSTLTVVGAIYLLTQKRNEDVTHLLQLMDSQKLFENSRYIN